MTTTTAITTITYINEDDDAGDDKDDSNNHNCYLGFMWLKLATRALYVIPYIKDPKTK